MLHEKYFNLSGLYTFTPPYKDKDAAIADRNKQLNEWEQKDIAKLERDYAGTLQRIKDLENELNEKDAEIRMLKKDKKEKTRGKGGKGGAIPFHQRHQPPAAAAEEEPDDNDDEGGRGGGRGKRPAPSPQPGSKNAKKQNKKRK